MSRVQARWQRSKQRRSYKYSLRRYSSAWQSWALWYRNILHSHVTMDATRVKRCCVGWTNGHKWPSIRSDGCTDSTTISLQNKIKWKVCKTNTEHKQGNLMISVLTLTPYEISPGSAGRKKRSRYKWKQTLNWRCLLLTAFVSNIDESAIITEKSVTQVVSQNERPVNRNEPINVKLQAYAPTCTTLIDPP